jgi:hypothetical protein
VYQNFVDSSDIGSLTSLGSLSLLGILTLAPAVQIVHNGAATSASNNPLNFLVAIIDFLVFSLLA